MTTSRTTITRVWPETLHAALKREGIWLVDAVTGSPTDFYHKACFDLKTRTAPRPELAVWASQLDRDAFTGFLSPIVRANHVYLSRRERLDYGR